MPAGKPGAATMPEQYQKQALSFEQQLERLCHRGLVVASKDAALAALSSMTQTGSIQLHLAMIEFLYLINIEASTEGSGQR